MTKKITIDFETRSEADLKTVGAWAYAEHSTTQVICASFKIDGEVVGTWWPDWVDEILVASDLELPDRYAPPIDEMEDINSLFEAHNAEFERAIWHHIMTKRHGWPEVPIRRWRCSAAKAAAHSIPRALGKAGAEMELPIQKDEDGHKLMLKMCKPRNPLKGEKIEWLLAQGLIEDKKSFTAELLEFAANNTPTLWHETPEQMLRQFQYCETDVEAEHCLSETLRDLSDDEQKVWFLDQEINMRGVKADIETATAAVEIIEQYETELLAEFVELTGGAVNTPGQNKAFRRWLATLGADLPNLQKDTVAEWVELEDLNPTARGALELCIILKNTATKKIPAMIAGSNEDGRVRGSYMYHGGHTGRWAGKRVQTQNILRPLFSNIDECIEVIKEKDLDALQTFWGDDIKRTIASCIRGMLIAEFGHDLVCADFAAIEARVLAWLAQELLPLECFRTGLDIYKVAACDIFGVTYEEVTVDQRRVGKVAILALGFGGGVGAFQKMAVNYGVIVADDVAQGIVDRWREANPNIVKYWKCMEGAAIKAVKTGKPQQYRGIRWGVFDDFLYCKLPSGRLLAYPKPRIRKKRTPWGSMNDTLYYRGQHTTTRQWTWVDTYGGKLTENIVQAVARDLLVGAMLRVEEAGYKIVMHVHDEIVAEVPEGFGDLDEFCALMAEVPDWAEGCPVGAEGWRGKRYRK